MKNSFQDWSGGGGNTGSGEIKMGSGERALNSDINLYFDTTSKNKIDWANDKDNAMDLNHSSLNFIIKQVVNVGEKKWL